MSHICVYLILQPNFSFSESKKIPEGFVKDSYEEISQAQLYENGQLMSVFIEEFLRA